MLPLFKQTLNQLNHFYSHTFSHVPFLCMKPKPYFTSPYFLTDPFFNPILFFPTGGGEAVPILKKGFPRLFLSPNPSPQFCYLSPFFIQAPLHTPCFTTTPYFKHTPFVYMTQFLSLPFFPKLSFLDSFAISRSHFHT